MALSRIFSFYSSLLLTSLICAWAQQTPSITYISPDLVVDTGDAASLSCRIADAQEYPILWMRLGQNSSGDTPMSVGSNLLAMDQQRISLDHDQKTSTYGLTIKDVQLSDEATYQCQVLVALNQKLTKEVKLQIRKAPIIISEESTHNLRAKFGSQAKFVCRASGFPLPQIKWIRANGALFANGEESIGLEQLVLNNLRMEDAGDYLCVANNEIGPEVRHKAHLDVEFAPRIEIMKPKVAQALMYDAELECKIRALPSAAIVWSKNEQQIDVDNNDKFSVDNFEQEQHLVVSTLLIRAVEKADYGNYSCSAGNRHGEDEQRVELYESKMPICPPVCGEIDLDNGATNNHYCFNLILLAFSLALFKLIQ